MRKGVLRGAHVHLRIIVEAVLVLEHWTVLDDAGVCSTRIYRTREHAAVPAVHEVAVQSVTGRVTIGEDEAAFLGVERLYAEPNLIEDGDEVLRVRGWASTVVDTVRVGHMRLVIRRVEVYTIPAGREKDLSPKAIWAISIAETWSLRHIKIIEVNAGRSSKSITIAKVLERD